MQSWFHAHVFLHWSSKPPNFAWTHILRRVQYILDAIHPVRTEFVFLFISGLHSLLSLTTQLRKKDCDWFCCLVRNLNSIKTSSRKIYLTKTCSTLKHKLWKLRRQKALKWEFYIMIKNLCLKCHLNHKIHDFSKCLKKKSALFSQVYYIWK